LKNNKKRTLPSLDSLLFDRHPLNKIEPTSGGQRVTIWKSSELFNNDETG